MVMSREVAGTRRYPVQLAKCPLVPEANKQAKVEKDGRGLDPHMKLRHDGFWSEMYACFGGRSYAQFASPPCLLLSTPNSLLNILLCLQIPKSTQTKAHLLLHPSDDISPPCRHTTNLCFVLGKSKIQNLRGRSPSPERRNASLTRSKSTMPQYKPLALIPRQGIRSSTHICRIIIFRIL